MRLHRLVIEGIGPYADRQDLDFDQLSSGGLFLLTGPTGAGKTTILDAIVYALYGTVPGVRGVGSRGDKGTSDRIVSDLRSVESQPRVELEITVGGRRLRLERVPQHLRPKARGEGLTVEKGSVALSEWREDAWQPRSSDPQEVAIEIGDLLGMNAAQFAQVVLLPQGEFAGFLRAGDKERREVLRRLFHVEEYRSAEHWFQERAAEAKARLETAEADLRGIVDQLAGALGTPAGDLPADRTLDTVGAWIDERRFEADELGELARVGAETAAATKARAERAVRATEELVARLHDRDERTAALGILDARLPRAREWIAEHVDPALAADAVRWAEAAAAAQEHAARLQERLADAERARQLEAAAAAAERDGAAAEQGALAAEARVQELGPMVRAAQEAAARSEVAEGTLAALQGERERIAAALQAATRRDAHARELLTAQRTVAEARAALEQACAARDAAPATAEAEATLQARADALTEGERALAAADAALATAATEAARAEERRASAVALATQLEAARVAQAAGHEAWQQAREAHLTAREARLDAMAAELATALTDGEPCAVCGSPHHPAPAPPAPGGDLRAAEAAAEQRAGQARADAERANAQVAALSGQLEAVGAPEALGAAAREARRAQEQAAAARADATGRLEALHAQAAAARDALGAARRSEAAVTAAERADAEARHAETMLRAALETATREAGPDPLSADDLRAADEELARLRARRAAAAQERDRATKLEAELEQRRAEAGQLRERSAAASSTARARREEATTLAAHLAELVGPSADLSAAAEQARERARGLALAVDLVAQRVTAEQEVDRAQAAVAAAQAAEQPAADEPEAPAERLAARQAAAAEAERSREEASARQRDAARHAAAIAAATAAFEAARDALGPAADEAERLQRLDATVRGLGDNRRRISLTTYVLAARLEEVAAAATTHLERMSGGRYALLHHDERFGNGPAGLGLRVLDAYSGEERDTATLSGGEAFYASLALALGLADVVQAESGGRALETLLVDEGFGSLDADTLDEVLGELDELRAAGRAIGLVSHVPALAERIPAQLRVSAGPRGSSARVLIGDLAT